MTKSELLDTISEKTGVSKKEVDSVLTSFIDTVECAVLKNGDTISLPGLGTFKQKNSAAREGRNPATGESLQIPARTSIAFKMSSSLKAQK